MEETKDTAAPDQGAAQPEATGATPAKSAAETKLEKQLADAKTAGDGYKKERDAARKDLAASNKERDKAQADLGTAQGTIATQGEEITRLTAELASRPTSTVLSTEADTPAEPSEEDTIKDVLKRNGLKVAYMLPSGPCFSKGHAREFAGDQFDSLRTITLD